MSKRVFLDWLECAVAGSTAPGSREIVEMINGFEGREEASIIPFDLKAPRPNAALANGTISHALDFDDTHDEAVLHTSVAVAPAALAVAEVERLSGRDFIAALVAGMETHIRIGLGCTTGPGQSGWIYTASIGTFGAAVAAGKVLGLSEEQMINAVGVAYSAASGNIQSVISGSLSKRLQPGLSAMSGVLAALLAQKGFTGPVDTLEGRFGFYNVYQQGNYRLDRPVEGLGERFEVLNLSLKPYPCCRFTHTAIDAAIKVTNMHDINVNDVEEVKAYVHSQTYSVVCDPLERKIHPQTIVDAQFSLPYTAACGLVQKRVVIDDFTEEAIKRRNIIRLAEKIKPQVDPALEETTDRSIAPTIIEIRMRDGKVYDACADIPKGHPKNPMTTEEQYEKFKDCARHSVKPISDEKIKEIMTLVEKLEAVSDMSELTCLL